MAILGGVFQQLIGGLAPPTEELDKAKTEKELVSKIRSEVEEIRASANRVAHEGIWLTNIAYLLGYDGIAFNTGSRQFQPINRGSGGYLKKNRIHVNKILPTIQNRLAKLCKNRPRFDVKPESNEVGDREAARLSLQVLLSLWDTLGLDEKRLSLYMWVQQAGHAYIKVCWDDSLGKLMQDPLTGEHEFEGDVRVDIVSPFEIFVDPLAKHFSEAAWVIQAKVRKLDYFKTQYAEKGEAVKEEDVWLMSAQYEQKINSMNAKGPSQGSLMDQVKKSAIELIKYEKRSKNYPNGRMVVVANGVLLEDKELPCGEIPLAKFDDVIIGGKYYSESIITHLRPIQDQYNTTIRKRAEWTKRLLAGKFIAARGTALSQESLNDESGEVAYYTPVPNAANGGEPHSLDIPTIPQYAYTEEEKLNEQINYISGISEVSRGSLPSASIPAVGMQLLVEQDDTRIGVINEQHEHAWARVGGLMLKYYSKYVTNPRKLKIAGKNEEYNIRQVKGADLQDNTDVTVIRGSTLPGSKVLRRQEIMNLFSQGLLGDPNDPKVKENVLSMLEFGDLAEVWQDNAVDKSQIKRGLDRIKQGIPFPVDIKDNHPLWIQELNRFRKSEQYEHLDPSIQGLLEQTIDQHTDAMIELSGANQEAQINDIASQPLPSDMVPPEGMGPEQAPIPEEPAMDQNAPTGGL